MGVSSNRAPLLGCASPRYYIAYNMICLAYLTRYIDPLTYETDRRATISPPAMLTGQIKCKTPMCQGRESASLERHFSWDEFAHLAAISHGRACITHTFKHHMVGEWNFLGGPQIPCCTFLGCFLRTSSHFHSRATMRNAKCMIPYLYGRGKKDDAYAFCYTYIYIMYNVSRAEAEPLYECVRSAFNYNALRWMSERDALAPPRKGCSLIVPLSFRICMYFSSVPTLMRSCVILCGQSSKAWQRANHHLCNLIGLWSNAGATFSECQECAAICDSLLMLGLLS